MSEDGNGLRGGRIDQRPEGAHLVGVLDVDLVEPLSQCENFLRSDGDVGGLALGPARGLVNHHASVRERPPLTGRAGAQENGSNGASLANAQRVNWVGYVLHRVVNRETCGDGTPRRINVHVDLRPRVRTRKEANEV